MKNTIKTVIICWIVSASIVFGQSDQRLELTTDPLVAEAVKNLELAQRQYANLLKLNRNNTASNQAVAESKHKVELAELRLREAELITAQIPDEQKMVLRRDLGTALAQSKVRFATSEYETAKRLHARGARSKLELRRALYILKLSKIELRRAKITASELSEKEKLGQSNELAIESAQLKSDVAKSEYEMMKRLYQKSNVSKRRLLYSHYVAKIARLELTAAKVEASARSDLEKRFKLSDLAFEKANSGHKYLKSVHEANRTLFERGRISKAEFMQSLEDLRESEIKLEAARAASISEIET